MSKPIVKAQKRATIKLFEGYCAEDGEEKSLLFASDGTRKPLKEEFADVYRSHYGADCEPDAIGDIYSLGEVHDYTTGKNYTIILRPKLRQGRHV